MSQTSGVQTRKTSPASPNPRKTAEPAREAMPFRRRNYQLLGLGVVLLLIGYVLLVVPAHFVDAREFSPALYIAPIVIMSGFGVLFYAILAK